LNDQEPAHRQTQKVVDLLSILDPEFKRAPITGLPRARPLLSAALEALIFLKLPIFYLDELLRKPKEWLPKLEGLKELSPKSYYYLKDLTQLQARGKDELFKFTEPLINRLPLFTDPATIAFASAQYKPVSWGEQTVYLDFSGDEGNETQNIKLMWVWKDLIRYLKQRVKEENPKPLAIIIDELLAFNDFNDTELSKDIKNIITMYKGKGNIFFCVATQDLSLLSERMQRVMMNMGNFLIGRVTDEEIKLKLSRRFFPTDPLKTKDAPIVIPSEDKIKADLSKPLDEQTLRHEFDIYADMYQRTGRKHLFEVEKEYSTVDSNLLKSGLAENFTAVPKPKNLTYMSPQEQHEENAKVFDELDPYEWLLGIADGTSPARTLTPYSSKDIKHLYSQSQVDEKKWQSVERYGVFIPMILPEMVTREEQKSAKNASGNGHKKEPEVKSMPHTAQTAGFREPNMGFKANGKAQKQSRGRKRKVGKL
jgi:hypothetical protein